jgi:hypothetical protein
MPGSNLVFEHSFSGNYPLVLARKMQFQALKTMFWGKWAGFTTPGMVPVKPGNDPKPTESPVVIQNELSKAAGDLMEIPLHRNLKQLWRIGKEQMEGHEEEPKINFMQVPVELFRHAETPQDVSISTKVNKDLRLLENTEPALRRHYARAMNYLMCSFAIYHGYSWNVLASARWSGDSKVSTKQHPHVYIAGRGKVSYTTYGYPGNAAYNQGVATEIDAIGVGDTFDTGFLNGMKADATIQKIAPIIMKDGNALRLIIAHTWQISSLEADSAFRETVALAAAQSYSKENPYLYGCKYVWGGFAIFESDTMVWPVTTGSSLPVWGPSTVQVATKTGNLDSFESYSSATKFGAIILGSNALALGLASRMEFKRRVDDYDELIGIAYRQIGGAARADFWNREDGATGVYMVNESSALAVTYAAAPGF